MMEEKLISSPEVDYRQMALHIAGGELTSGGQLRLRVIGDSMFPLLCSGDHVLVSPVDVKTLRRGDLVVVLRNGEVITHRIVGRERRGWRTKGDNRRQTDPTCLPENILGRVSAVQRGNKRVDLDNRPARLANRLLGRLGACEAAVFFGSAVVRRVFVTQRATGRLTGLARRLASPFAWLRKIIYKAYPVEFS